MPPAAHQAIATREEPAATRDKASGLTSEAPCALCSQHLHHLHSTHVLQPDEGSLDVLSSCSCLLGHQTPQCPSGFQSTASAVLWSSHPACLPRPCCTPSAPGPIPAWRLLFKINKEQEPQTAP